MLGTTVLSSFPFQVLSRGPYNEGCCTTEWRSCNWRLIYWKFLSMSVVIPLGFSSTSYLSYGAPQHYPPLMAGWWQLHLLNEQEELISKLDIFLFLLDLIFIVDTVTDVPTSPPSLSTSTHTPHNFLFNPNPRTCFC